MAEGSKGAKRQMIGLRMDPPELNECKQYAVADNRSAAQFALMMYRRGLADFQREHGAPQKPRRRGGAK